MDLNTCADFINVTLTFIVAKKNKLDNSMREYDSESGNQKLNVLH